MLKEERQPKVSIVIPVYNTEKYLAKCMDSLLCQTLRDIEIILVNDGSQDSSGALCDEYMRTDARVKTFHKSNGGVSSARNLGIQHITGEYLAFVDPDDWVELDTYERLVREIEKYQADVVFFGYDEVPENGRGSDVIVHSPEKTGEGDAKEGVRQMMLGIGKGYFTLIANKLLRTELCTDADGQIHRFDETIAVGEDGLWLVDVIMKAERVCFDSSVYYHWLIRDNSACHVKRLTPARLSAIESQRRIIERVACYGEEILRLTQAKAYHDSFALLVTAYLDKDVVVFRDIQDKIEPYQRVFFEHEEISVFRKIKTNLCLFLMDVGIHSAVVEWIDRISLHEIKKKLKLSRKT